MSKFEDLTGREFDRLTVIRRAPNMGERTAWLCHCKCGNDHVVRANQLINHTIRSCGCLRDENTKARRTKHGCARHGIRNPEYVIWCGIINRCESPRHERFADYGGRGITICQQWRRSFETFIADMGPRPAPGMSIGRKDNDKGYEPGNCEWQTSVQQARNARSNLMITLGSETKCLAEWCELKGRNYGTVKTRLYRGWSPERAFEEPIK